MSSYMMVLVIAAGTGMFAALAKAKVHIDNATAALKELEDE